MKLHWYMKINKDTMSIEFNKWWIIFQKMRFFIKKKSSLKDIQGKWPGDETDEEFEEIIKSLKNREDKVDNPLFIKGKIAR